MTVVISSSLNTLDGVVLKLRKYMVYLVEESKQR